MNPNTLLLPTVWPRAEPTTVARCVLLALLAHVCVVLTLGNAPGGTARPGEGVWGAVNVTLRGPETPGAVDLPRPPEPAVATGPAGLAETPRWGGAVRTQTAPEPPPEPGAAQVGHWVPLPTPSAAQPALTPLSRAPSLQPALPAGPLPDPGRVLEERASASPPPPAPAVAAPSVTAAVPAPAPAPVPATAPATAPGPAPLPPPERTLASTLSGPVAPAATAEPALAATTPTAPVLGRLPELNAPAAAPLMAPRVAPPPPAAPVAALSQTQPAVTPVVVAQPPVAALRSLNAPLAPAATPTPTAATPAPPAPPVAAMPVSPPATAPVMASPVTAGLPSSGLAAGAADAGTRLGHDVAGAPALPASAPPRLNLQLARPRGGELSRGLGGGVLAVLPRPPEVDEKLGQQIAKAAKADCRSAYAGAGLLAVLPLVVEAVRKDGSCKW